MGKKNVINGSLKKAISVIWGACVRVTLKVWRQEQEWHDKRVVSDVHWEGDYSYPVENEIPEGWYDVGEKYLIEKYDVWKNINRDFLLATTILKS